MSQAPLSRRTFLKTSAAGTLLCTSTVGLGQTADTYPAPPPPPSSSPSLSTMGDLGTPLPPPPDWVVFRSDLSRCQPADRLTRDRVNGKWVLHDYETQEGVKGVMASAYPEEDAGELTLPLEVEGPHKIYLGINYTKVDHGHSGYGEIQVKLTRDMGFRRVAIEAGTLDDSGSQKIGHDTNHNHKSIQEPFWKIADLTGQALTFRQPGPPYDFPRHQPLANLSYIKLIPLTAEEIAEWKGNQPSENTKRVAVIYCTGHMTGHLRGSYTYHPTSQDWFANEFSPYIDSDIGLFIFEAMRGNYCLFKTKIGDVGNEVNAWQAEWADPLAEFTALARAHGIKIFASLRMTGAQYPMNRAPIARARYFWKLRQYAKIDRYGVPTSNLSIAYPEVRNHWLGLLREALEYGIDGVQLHLNRATPFVMYEEPVLQAFMEKYGEDPRKLSELDPRWMRHGASYVTGYLREVRALLDEKPGRQLGITLYGHPHDYDPYRENFHPLRYQCDVETWISKGLVDYLMPNKYIDLDLLRKWRDLGGARVHLYPDLMPRTQLPKEYAALAQKYYDHGADGVVTWDGERRAPRISEWAAVQQLGHVAGLGHIINTNDDYYRRIPLKTLAGFSTEHSFHDG